MKLTAQYLVAECSEASPYAFREAKWAFNFGTDIRVLYQPTESVVETHYKFLLV